MILICQPLPSSSLLEITHSNNLENKVRLIYVKFKLLYFKKLKFNYTLLLIIAYSTSLARVLI